MLYYKSPLSWPESIPITPLVKQRSDNGFSSNITLTDAVSFLKEEIETLAIGHAVLYSDIEQPHVERLRKKLGNRSGVCLHIKYKERGYIITCDKWQRIEHNIYALHLLFRQWGNIEKWGIGNLSMLMSGFEADRTPEISGIAKDHENIAECLKSFGLGSTATLDDATAIYHRRAKSLAGNNEDLTKLNLQMDEIRNYFTSKSED